MVIPEESAKIPKELETMEGLNPSPRSQIPHPPGPGERQECEPSSKRELMFASQHGSSSALKLKSSKENKRGCSMPASPGSTAEPLPAFAFPEQKPYVAKQGASGLGQQELDAMIQRLSPAQVQQMMAALDLGSLYYRVLEGLEEDSMEELHYTRALEGVGGYELCEAIFKNEQQFFQTEDEARKTMRRLSDWAWAHGIKTVLPRAYKHPSKLSASNAGAASNNVAAALRTWPSRGKQNLPHIAELYPRGAETGKPSRRNSVTLRLGKSECSPHRLQRISEVMRTVVKKERQRDYEDMTARPEWCHNFKAAAGETLRSDRGTSDSHRAARASLCKKWKVNTRPSGAIQAWIAHDPR